MGACCERQYFSEYNRVVSAATLGRTGTEKEGYKLLPASSSLFETKREPWANRNPWSYFFIVLLVMILTFGLLLLIAQLTLNYVPNPRPDSNTPPYVFSGERAHDTVLALVQSIGPRPIGSDALHNRTVPYLLTRLLVLQDEAKRRTDDVRLHLYVEDSTGAYTSVDGLVFSWQDLVNIVAVISTNATAQEKGLLVSARMDSVFVGPGAASDAAGVGVMLEMIGNLVSNTRPSTDANQYVAFNRPLYFTFLGAGEGRGAAAIMNQYASKLGAFINLDSFGASGEAVLFRAAGKVLGQQFANAVHPSRAGLASVLLADLYDVGLLTVHTDFEVYSQYSSNALPGLEFGFYRNGYVFHTQFDNILQVQSDSLQQLGDNVYLTVRKLVMDPSSWDNGAVRTDTNLHELVYYDYVGVGPLVLTYQTQIILNYVLAFCVVVFFIVVYLIAAHSTPSTVLAPSIPTPMPTQAKSLAQSTTLKRISLPRFLAYVFSGVGAVLLSVAFLTAICFLLGGFLTWASPLAYFRTPYFVLFISVPIVLLSTELAQWAMHVVWGKRGVKWQHMASYSYWGVMVAWWFTLMVATPISRSVAVLAFWWNIWLMIGWILMTLCTYLYHHCVTHWGKFSLDFQHDFWFVGFVVATVPPGLLQTQWLFQFLEVVIPASGRMGLGVVLNKALHSIGLRQPYLEIRPDILLLLVSASIVFGVYAIAIPLIHRRRAFLITTVVLLVLFVIGVIVVVSVPTFSEQTPQRLHMTHLGVYQSLNSSAAHSSPTLLSSIGSLSSLDERSISYTLNGINTTGWVCRTRTSCKFPAAAPTVPYLPYATLLADQYDSVADTRNVTIRFHNLGMYFNAWAFDTPLRSWSLTPELPPRYKGFYTVNHQVGKWKPSQHNGDNPYLDVQLCVFGRVPIQFTLRAHWYVLDATLESLLSKLPDWTTLDPLGNYVTVESVMTL